MRLTAYLVAGAPPFTEVECGACGAVLSDIAYSKLVDGERWAGWLCLPCVTEWREHTGAST